MLIIETGKKYGKIIDASGAVLKALVKIFTFTVPGSYFMKNKHRWDGKKRFISKDGKFRVGLLQEIEKILEKNSIKYQVKKFSKNSWIIHRWPSFKEVEGFLQNHYGSNFKLRVFQQNLIHYVFSKEKGLFQAPTGSGKTVVLAALALSSAKFGIPTVFLFPKKQILIQTYTLFKALGLDVGIACGDGLDIKPITLATIQSIHKISAIYKSTQRVIVDEVHEFSNGKKALEGLDLFTECENFLGFSATIPTDKIPYYNLVERFSSIQYKVEANDLILEGFLTKPLVLFKKISYDIDPKDIIATYPNIYDKYIINSTKRNCEIYKQVAKWSDPLQVVSKILILVKNLEHQDILEGKLSNAGFSVVCLRGSSTLEERKKAIETFQKNTFSTVLIGTVILQTGVDIPEITHFINARGLKSEIATIQAIGRALRLHHTKKEVVCYDFYDEVKYLEKHSRQRLQTYTEKQFEVRIDEE